ncbi:hypothetical protein PIB30_077603 [Stylosanthes scabra]|uniref:Uncharacterized protein n=1 Tax=Stylosanthes scabra TaxID=79078 RepID=A0ABU6ZPU6_9FABA|nr:hypothetical protein [Stylosanthes scabra]
MKQIRNVNDYFSIFFLFAKKLGWNDSERLKNFIGGLENYIHREIIIDDPQTHAYAIDLAKFYEELWLNPYSEAAKPEIQASTIQFHRFQTNFSNVSTIYEVESPELTIQNSKINLDPEIQKSEQAGAEAEPKFHTQIESVMQEQCHLIQHSIGNSTLKDSDQLTDRLDLQLECPNLVPTFLDGGKGGPRSPICAIGVDITMLASNNSDEDDAVAKGNVVDANAEPILHVVEKERVNQPPPKPPDLPLHAWVLGGAEDDANLKRSGGTKIEEAVTLTSSGGDASDVDNRGRGSAEVGAFVRRKWTVVTAKEGATATITNGSPRARQLRRFFLLTPLPLLATALPWNNDRERTGDDAVDDGAYGDNGQRNPLRKKQYVVVVKTVGCTFEGGCVGGTGDGGPAPWNGSRDGVKGVPSFFLLDSVERLEFLEPHTTLHQHSLGIEERGELLPPVSTLGLQEGNPAQLQFHYCGSTIGSILTENSFENVGGPLFFKQWDPGAVPLGSGEGLNWMSAAVEGPALGIFFLLQCRRDTALVGRGECRWEGCGIGGMGVPLGGSRHLWRVVTQHTPTALA